MRRVAVHSSISEDPRAMQSTLNKIFIVQGFYDIVGRHMLTNIGSSEFVALAVVLAGVQEILLRTTLLEQDSLFRRIFGRNEKLTDKAKKRELLTFSSMIVGGMVIENANIIIAGVCKYRFAPFAHIYDFGFQEGVIVTPDVVVSEVFMMLIQYRFW